MGRVMAETTQFWGGDWGHGSWGWGHGSWGGPFWASAGEEGQEGDSLRQKGRLGWGLSSLSLTLQGSFPTLHGDVHRKSLLQRHPGISYSCSCHTQQQGSGIPGRLQGSFGDWLLLIALAAHVPSCREGGGGGQLRARDGVQRTTKYPPAQG